MRHLKLAVPGLILFGGILMSTSSVYGTPDYAKKEKKMCNTCHSKMTSDKAEMAKSLNDTGKCYAANSHTLDKCAK